MDVYSSDLPRQHRVCPLGRRDARRRRTLQEGWDGEDVCKTTPECHYEQQSRSNSVHADESRVEYLKTKDDTNNSI